MITRVGETEDREEPTNREYPVAGGMLNDKNETEAQAEREATQPRAPSGTALDQDGKNESELCFFIAALVTRTRTQQSNPSLYSVVLLQIQKCLHNVLFKY